MLASLRRVVVGILWACLCVLVFDVAQRCGWAQNPPEVPAYNYSKCINTNTLTCQNCLSEMVYWPNNGFENCATGWVCGAFTSTQTVAMSACRQTSDSTSTCTAQGQIIFTCTGGSFFVCGCGTVNNTTTPPQIDCTGSGGGNAGGCTNNCRGNPQATNVSYPAGVTCT